MKKILVVDDSMMMRERIKEIVTKCGEFTITEAGDGEQAIALYKENKPNLVTLDISMPGKNGIEALTEIMQIDTNANIVIISAVAQKQLIIQAISIGAKDFINKPFNEEEATNFIKSHL